MSGVLDELRAHPQDRDRHLAYADWLQARGDAHGELIALQLAAEECESLVEFESLCARAHALFEAEPSLQLNPTPDDPRPLGVWTCWRWGFVRQLDMRFGDRWLGSDSKRDEAQIESFTRLLEHPCLALVSCLRIHVSHPNVMGLAMLFGAGLARHRERGHALPRIECIPHRPHAHNVQALLEHVFKVPATARAAQLPRLEAQPGSPLRPLLAALDAAPAPKLPITLLWIDGHGPRVRSYPTGGADILRPGTAGFLECYATCVLRHDRLVERRVAALLAGLAFEFDGWGHTGGPRPAWTRAPRPTSPAAGCDHLSAAWGEASAAVSRALVPHFPAAQAWVRVSEPIDAGPRYRASGPTTCDALVGLGRDWMLSIAVRS